MWLHKMGKMLIEIAQPTEPEKNTVKVRLNHLVKNYGYWQKGELS